MPDWIEMAFGRQPKRASADTCEFDDLGDEAAIDEMIAFANGTQSPDPQYRDRELTRAEELRLLSTSPLPWPRSDIARTVKQIEEERAFAHAVLLAAARGTKALYTTAFTPENTKLFREILATPYLQPRKGGNYKLTWALDESIALSLLRGAKPAILYLAAVLLDGAKAKRTSVGYCKLKTCGQFFRVVQEGRGRPHREHCCKEHMLERNEELKLIAKRKERARARRKHA